MKTKLTLARSIAGILNRSTSTDKVVFGSDTILLEDAVKYTSTNMKFWSPHPQAVLLPVLNHDKELSVNIQNSQSAFKFQYILLYYLKKDENCESKLSNFSKNMSNY